MALITIDITQEELLEMGYDYFKNKKYFKNPSWLEINNSAKIITLYTSYLSENNRLYEQSNDYNFGYIETLNYLHSKNIIQGRLENYNAIYHNDHFNKQSKKVQLQEISEIIEIISLLELKLLYNNLDELNEDLPDLSYDFSEIPKYHKRLKQ